MISRLSNYPKKILTLIANLKKLKGVGTRTAERYAFDIIDWKEEEIILFSNLLSSIKKNLKKCEICGCIKENICFFCDEKRIQNIICIIGSSKDAYAIEKTNTYNGLYHVFEMLSSYNGYQVDELKLKKLENRIHKNKLFDPIGLWLSENKSFFGICLGLQLLFENSEESPGIKGFGIIKGTCKLFQEDKVPQIGWNNIHNVMDNPLLENLDSDSYFYFVHSYYCHPQENECVLATTDYNIIYPSIIGRGNVYAVQFHPEKSGATGIQLLKNWIEKC